MKSYANLTNVYSIGNNEAGSIVLRDAPLYFVRSGAHYYSNGYINILGSIGLYWSSTAPTTNNAYSLRFSGSSVDPQFNDRRGYGYSLRCVAR